MKIIAFVLLSLSLSCAPGFAGPGHEPMSGHVKDRLHNK